MSRLTEELVLEGLNHNDIDVRTLCLEYFTQCFSRNPQVMPAVIRAFERFGWDKAFRQFFELDHLVQTESTVQWIVDTIGKAIDSNAAHVGTIHVFRRVLCEVEPRLVHPHLETILALPGFKREIDAGFVHRLTTSQEILDWDGDKLWHALEAIPGDFEEVIYSTDLNWKRAEAIADELAHQGECHVPVIMEVMGQAYDENTPPRIDWLMPFAVRLAGELRLEAAAPRIIELLQEDDDVLGEEGRVALQKIGGDAVVKAIAEQYRDGDEFYRMSAIDILGSIHTDVALQVTLDLLSKTEEADQQTWLVHPLIGQFSTEANEVARTTLLQNIDLGFMPLYDMKSLRGELAASCALTGQDFPELKKWREAYVQQQRGIERRTREFFQSAESPPLAPRPTRPALPFRQPEPVHSAPRAGRNDPCPCGSGKKYKKCCLNK